jgi:D-serine deaminase-like pyridoxal phosphate-dependent protein
MPAGGTIFVCAAPGKGSRYHRLRNCTLASNESNAMQAMPATIGASVDEIDTPALVVDLDAFEHNLRHMAAFTRDAGIRLRPHAKTHKCPAIALLQIEAGAVGQCCQKVGEAEALVHGGVRDVLVSNEVVGPAKLQRLAALARVANIALCFDDAGQVAAASRAATEAGVTLGGLVEIDVGMQRCGVSSPEQAVMLAQRIAEAPGLQFRGLQAYHGTAQHLPSPAQREAAIGRAAAIVRATVEALRAKGLPCEFVSGAGTGTFRLESASGVWNELQAGSYLFMDTDYARIGSEHGPRYDEFRHSLYVLATVMSVPLRTRAVVDAGLKSYSGEKGVPWVRDRPGLTVTGMSDEHGKIELGPEAEPLRIGDRLWLIPGHCDPTINLHDVYVGVRNGRVEALWPITARGASR